MRGQKEVKEMDDAMVIKCRQRSEDTSGLGKVQGSELEPKRERVRPPHPVVRRAAWQGRRADYPEVRGGETE